MSGSVSELKPKPSRRPKRDLEKRTFKDGAISLYRRTDSKKPIWYCRLKVPNAKGYFVHSTKTTDEYAAYKFADDLFNKTLVKVLTGKDFTSKLVSAALKEYTKFCEEKEPESFSRYLKLAFINKWTGFFSNQRLKELKTADLVQLNEWTEANSRSRKLSPNTIKRFSVYQRQFFKWCLERGLIDVIPKFPSFKTIHNRRPHFDPKDWEKLKSVLGEFTNSKNPNVRRDRTVLANYILILAESGIRIGEARNLKWRDIREIPSPHGSKTETIVVLSVNGKTGPRDVVARSPEVRDYLRDIYQLQVDDLERRVRDEKNRIKSQKLKTEPSPDDYVFQTRNGGPIDSYKTSFSRLLKKAGVERDSYGNKRTMYSLRHTYATFLLQEGVHHFILAKNMGTSVAMLEKHYGHTSNVGSVAELTTRYEIKHGLTQRE